MLDLINNPYFVLFLTIVIGGLGYVMWRPEAIPAFIFLLLSALWVFYDVANLQRLALLKAVLLSALLVVLLLRKSRSGEGLPLAGFVWVLSYGAFVVFSCLINGTDINEYRGALGILMIPLVVALCPNNEKTVKYLTIALALWGIANFLAVLANWVGIGWAQAFVTEDQTNITFRAAGLMGHSTVMGMYFVISLNAVQVLYYQAGTRKGRLLLLTIGTSLFLGLVSTVSVAAFAGWGVSFLYIRHRLGSLRLSNLIGIGILALLLFSFAALLKEEPLMMSRLSSLPSDESAVGRLTLLKMGMGLFSSNPLFGVGLGQGGRVHLETHNTFMQVLMETGIVGFLLFCGVLWISLRRLYQQTGQDKGTICTGKSAYYAGLLGSLMAILVNGLAHCNEYLMPLWLIIGIAFMV